MKKLFLFFIILTFAKTALAQNDKIDSLKKLISYHRENNNKPQLAKSLFDLGSEIISTNQTTEAITSFSNSSQLYQSLGDNEGYAWCLYKISYLYNLMGDYSKSFNHCLHANSIATSYSLKSLEGFCQNLLGRLYYLLSDEASAMKFYSKALTNGKIENNPKLIAESITYIAIVWRNRDSIQLSLKMQREALRIREIDRDEIGSAMSFLNIGILYSYMGRNDSAVVWLQKAESLWINYNDNFNLTECYNYLGKAWLKLNNNSVAENYFNKSLEIALKIRAKKMIRYNYYDLAMINYQKGNNTKAIEQILIYTAYKDSVIQDQGLLEIAHLEAQNLKEKNENDIKLLYKNNELKETQLAKNRIIIWSVAVGLILLILLSGFIFRSLQITRKQKRIIEEKNKDITDSINYAKRIHQSLLPTDTYIERNLKRLKKNI